jgi:Uma2 family endonuclease
MGTTALIPVEDYLHMTEKPTCEYREGALFRKPLPTKSHGVLEFLLVAMLRKQGLDAVAEVTVRLSPTRYLVPDVIAAPLLQSPYPTEPVLLCCEILSPEDRIGTMFAKCEEYHSWGVSFCWVIDPVKRTAWEYHSAAEPKRASGMLRAGDYAVSLKELFSALD